MTESKFWKPKGFSFNLKSLFPNGKSKDPQVNSMKVPTEVKPSLFVRLKNSYKKLGVFGAILIAVIGLLSLLLFFFVVKPSYALLSSINKLKSDQAKLVESFQAQDIEGINDALNSFKGDLSGLRNARDHNFAWMRGAPFFKDYYSDSEHFIRAGEYAADALLEFVVVAEPFADAAGFKYKGTVEVTDPNAGSGLAEAFATWVRVMPEVADKMDGVIDKADKVGEELAQVDARRYPESFKNVPIRSNIEAAQQYLTKASDYGPDIKAALTAIPPLLGVPDEKRYAIIMQNDAELRATGGFWTNYATFKVKNALLNSDFSSKDMYSIDEIISWTDTPYTSPWKPPKPPYRDFLKVEHTFARDANFSPDYVTSIDDWLWYYKKAGIISPGEVKPVNGVFAIDTRVISELLKITGPVSVGGVTYDSEGAVLELEKIASLGLKEQQGRKRVLGDVMEGMLVKMYQSEKNLWPKFVETAVRLAVEKHLLGYVLDDPKAQELLEKYNFAGRIVNYDKGDFSYVVSTNLGGNKNNIFVTKNVDHKIYEEGGKWIHEVSVNFTFGQPKPGYEPLVSVYKDWVRVFAPAGSVLVSVEGSDAKTEADTGEERGKVYFAGHITLEPSQNTTIKFKYEIPSSLIKDNVYNLYLEKQPGTNMDKHTVTVKDKTQTVELLSDRELNFKLNGK